MVFLVGLFVLVYIMYQRVATLKMPWPWLTPHDVHSFEHLSNLSREKHAQTDPSETDSLQVHAASLQDLSSMTGSALLHLTNLCREGCLLARKLH
jgi:hypothetical protein